MRATQGPLSTFTEVHDFVAKQSFFMKTLLFPVRGSYDIRARTRFVLCSIHRTTPPRRTAQPNWRVDPDHSGRGEGDEGEPLFWRSRRGEKKFNRISICNEYISATTGIIVVAEFAVGVSGTAVAAELVVIGRSFNCCLFCSCCSFLHRCCCFPFEKTSLALHLQVLFFSKKKIEVTGKVVDHVDVGSDVVAAADIVVADVAPAIDTVSSCVFSFEVYCSIPLY